jgi:HD-GYP domain-containing protein (c-di-GMP phosphodiesterase class II)
MISEEKTKQQLIEEVKLLRQQIAEQQSAESAHKQPEEALKQRLERLRKAFGGAIQTISLIVETRDPYLAGHQRRVARLASAIAREIGLSEEQIDGICLAGVVHDIGRISVPSEILSKPDRLTESELHLMKTYPQAGYEILKKIDFPWPLAQIVLQHQERMDGSGYPAGLSGEDILLEARVLSVSDTVDAMTSKRPYRPALSIEKALEEIVQNSGVLKYFYDSNIADACVRLFNEKSYNLEQ